MCRDVAAAAGKGQMPWSIRGKSLLRAPSRWNPWQRGRPQTWECASSRTGQAAWPRQVEGYAESFRWWWRRRWGQRPWEERKRKVQERPLEVGGQEPVERGPRPRPVECLEQKVGTPKEGRMEPSEMWMGCWAMAQRIRHAPILWDKQRCEWRVLGCFNSALFLLVLSPVCFGNYIYTERAWCAKPWWYMSLLREVGTPVCCWFLVGSCSRLENFLAHKYMSPKLGSVATNRFVYRKLLGGLGGFYPVPFGVPLWVSFTDFGFCIWKFTTL